MFEGDEGGLIGEGGGEGIKEFCFFLFFYDRNLCLRGGDHILHWISG